MATLNTEELSGEHSFRGCGFIKVNGLDVAVCGSKRVNFGRKGKVQYLDECIKRVPAEQEVKAVFSGILGTTTQAFIRDPETGKVLMSEDTLYGVPRGLCEPIGTTMVPVYPFRIWTNEALAATDNQIQAFDKPTYGNARFYITLHE